MKPTRATMLLCAGAALLVACRSWKTEPDIYQIDCNVPYAKVFLYDDDGEFVGTHNAGESFPKLEDDWTVEVRADGYETFRGSVAQLEIIGKKSWYARLRKSQPGG